MSPRRQKQGDCEDDVESGPAIKVAESTPLVASLDEGAAGRDGGYGAAFSAPLTPPPPTAAGARKRSLHAIAVPGSHSHSHDDNMSHILRDELDGMVKLALPVVATYLMEMFPGLVSIVLVGRIKVVDGDSGSSSYQIEQYIDATALAVAFTNLLGISLGIGLTTAMDTLCSQAFGANETKRMGTYLQTGVIVLTLTSLIVAVLFHRSTDILLGLGQPEEVAELAGVAIRYLFPGVPAMYFYELLRKTLQAQNIAAPMFFVAVAANVINATLGYHLVYRTEWGWLGASVARTVCGLSLPAFLLLYLVWTGSMAPFWAGLHPRSALAGVPEFLALGIPGMLQVCFEWWAFECLSLICGLLPGAVVDIGANAINLNVSSMMYMFYLGLAVSGNVRIGNALGAGDPDRARLAAGLVVAMAALVACLCAAFLLSVRNTLPRWFTHDEDITELASTLLVVAAIFQLPDAINGVVQGAFRGSGRQGLGARLNFVAYYTLGIPLGCALAFGGPCLGVVGLWLGMTAGLLLISIVGTWLVMSSDWVSLANDAQKRLKSQQQTR